MTADGSGVVVGVGGRGRVREGGQPLKKRKSNDVKDPPPGKPTCPECKREFFTWKAAFGHMRKHPNRAHRGFFPPPVFSSSSTATINPPAPQPIQNEGDGDNLSEGVTSIVRELLFDLNRSIYETEAGSSTNAAPTENQEGKKTKGFDLNELPSSEDDETQDN
ncbi:uncharacterized protein [Cicer arietinum]|uniref:uncharacterized protein n=1 Tax=Cicer arietinum TaxID=3827 RepID=UPI003CC6832A